jgi:hypothetical protein
VFTYVDDLEGLIKRILPSTKVLKEAVSSESE